MERVRAILAADDDVRRGLRLLGGLLLGIAMLVIAFRRGSFSEPWGEFALFLVVLAPCLFLYATGLLAARNEPRIRGWEGVYVIFGLLLLPICGFQFVELVNGDTAAPLNSVWIFGLTAAAGAAAALLGQVRYGLLLAALALIIAWLALWDEILADGLAADVGTLRGLLVLIALILLAAGFALYRPDRERDPAPDTDAATSDADDAALGRELTDQLKRRALHTGFVEIATGAAIAAVTAGAISIVAITGSIPFTDPPPAEASLLWDLELLVASLLSVAFAAWAAARGPGYVGAFGILLFIFVVGLDLDDDSPAGKLLGWPLILLLLGAAAFAASLLPGVGERIAGLRHRGETAPPPGDRV